MAGSRIPYALTGMARSLSKVAAGSGTSPPGVTGGRLYHAASDRHYTVIAARRVFGATPPPDRPGGAEMNVLEARCRLRDWFRQSRADVREPHGRRPLMQLPLSWYAERGGQWAMSPGYDRPAHLDFRRVIDDGCMSCHNGYPRDARRTIPKGRDLEPRSLRDRLSALPRPRDNSTSTKSDAVMSTPPPRAIVNPASLHRERQLDTCLQCHLESTSSPLPFQIRRYDRAPFSYVPGSRSPMTSSISITRRGAPATTSSKSTVRDIAFASRPVSRERDDVRDVPRSARRAARPGRGTALRRGL